MLVFVDRYLPGLIDIKVLKEVIALSWGETHIETDRFLYKVGFIDQVGTIGWKIKCFKVVSVLLFFFQETIDYHLNRKKCLLIWCILFVCLIPFLVDSKLLFILLYIKSIRLVSLCSTWFTIQSLSQI